MRILYVGNFRHTWDSESYIYRALLRAGVDVHPIDEESATTDLVAGELDRLRPDVFLFCKGRFFPGNHWEGNRGMLRTFIEENRSKFKLSACWVFDLLAPDFRRARWQWTKWISQECDFFFSTDGYSVELLRRKEIGSAHVLRQGIGDDVREGVFDEKIACDVLFLGSLYDSRPDEFDCLVDRFGKQFKVIGRGWRGAALSDLMASIKVVVGPKWPAFDGYWSNRLFVITGYGGCFITPSVVGMTEDGWIGGTHYMPRGDSDVMVEQIELLLADDARRKSLSSAGQQFCRENHTYDHRVAVMLEMFKKKLADK